MNNKRCMASLVFGLALFGAIICAHTPARTPARMHACTYAQHVLALTRSLTRSLVHALARAGAIIKVSGEAVAHKAKVAVKHRISRRLGESKPCGNATMMEARRKLLAAAYLLNGEKRVLEWSAPSALGRQ